MMKSLRFFTCLLVLSVLFVPIVSAAELNADYFHGDWVINDQSCSSNTAEHIVFHENGTFMGSRDGIAEIVGFWSLKDDFIELHMVTSPASFQDLHKEMAKFEGVYSYFQGRLLVFNQQKKSFEAYGVLGNESKRAAAVRCR